ncbi:MAG TPA: glycosyltransferase [Streptosporangiaceae bacterium]|jgi:galactofuranosylgalactofuranosylrhamnosyl-N-acetylglucosaminyl-diphospho-decaprenol beta-1,5/1,6-galactofuranosyltransferase
MTGGAGAPGAADGGAGLRVLQRIIFPSEDLDIAPLYVETNMDRGAAELASELLTQSLLKTKAITTTTPAANAAVGEAQSSIRFGTSLRPGLPGQAGPRHSAEISAGRRVSFATYFNAFPASYWRRWSTVNSVTLRVRLAGEATIIIYRSTAKGLSHMVATMETVTGEPETVQCTLPLTPFIDGGWYWFDIVAGPDGARLVEADWAAAPGAARAGRISIGITTYNRPDFMVETLRTLGEAAAALALIDAVYVVDQGTEKVRRHPDFADAAKGLGDRLTVIEQGNLGGSGGFARAMDETRRAGASDYLLLLDDDIKLEPEGIVRAVTFADFARRPTIVGGHMFSLYDRSVLHAFGETVAPYRWWWGPAPQTKHRHDFGRRNLRHTPWLHRRVDADYNGWWMCLIPVRVIEEIGLALPVFIKWDDAEYGLRARGSGYPTVSMPGVAAWHVPWQDKTDALDWQAYYHVRNRVVTALLHSPYDRGGRLVGEIAETQIQHLLSMQYSTAALRLLAIEDVLAGPGHLHRDLLGKMGQLNELRLRFSDANRETDIERFPLARRRRPPKKGREPVPPANKIGLFRKAAAGALRQLKAPREQAGQRPEVALPYQDATWWLLSNLDSALVSAADGASTAWYQRDPKLFRALALRSLRLHTRLVRDWSRLAESYRAAAAEFTSPQRWQQTFDASAGDANGPAPDSPARDSAARDVPARP